MSRRVVIDTQAFGRERASLCGELPVATLSRLLDVLTDTAGCLGYRLEGRIGERGRSQLLVEVDGVLSLRCQRCLEAIEYPLALRSLLEFVDSDDDLTQEELEDDSRDFLPEQHDLELFVLLEDEILLALPIVARHDDCVLPGDRPELAKVSPFSVLAGLPGKTQ
ncbi:MAG: YceD family protein [Candidatus Accumulibacter sp. UW26]|jgi:uncharacterized protein